MWEPYEMNKRSSFGFRHELLYHTHRQHSHMVFDAPFSLHLAVAFSPSNTFTDPFKFLEYNQPKLMRRPV